MGKHLNPLEKEVLIRQFKGNDKVKLYEFCKANNISMNSFRTWVRKYEAGGLEALARLDNTLPEVFPEGFKRSDEGFVGWRLWASLQAFRESRRGGHNEVTRRSPEFPLSVGQQKWAHVDSWAQR